MRHQLPNNVTAELDRVICLALSELIKTTRDKPTLRSAVMGAMAHYSQNNIDRLISDALRK